MTGITDTHRGRFRLIAVDLDGTLLDSAKTISARNREALARATAHGIGVAVISGRRIRELEALLPDISPDAFRVGHGGALIRRRGSTLFESPLPIPSAEAAIRVGKALDIHTLISERDGSIRIVTARADSPRVRRYLRTARPAPVLDPHPVFREAPLHLVLAGPPDRCREAETVLRSELGGTAGLERTEYRDTGLGLLDVLAPATDKGAALAWIARATGVPLACTLAIGDNWNDLAMLRTAGTGVMMANAAPELRGLGFEPTTGHDADGVAEALDRLVFGA